MDKRIGKAATILSKLRKKVWENKQLRANSKVSVYKACVISTLMNGSKSWTPCAAQERKLNVFDLRCLLQVLRLTWQNKVTNNEVLDKADIPSMYPLLHQRRIRWTCTSDGGWTHSKIPAVR